MATSAEKPQWSDVLNAINNICFFLTVRVAQDLGASVCKFRFSMPNFKYYHKERSGGQEYDETMINLSCTLLCTQRAADKQCFLVVLQGRMAGPTDQDRT